MAFSALDSALTGPLFATERMRAVFSDEARIADMIAVEAALARAQARLRLAPEGLAAAIEAIDPSRLDLGAIGAATAEAGVPSIPIVAALRAALPEGLAPHLHAGATSQDLLDTALALALRRAFALVAQDADAVLAGLSALASRHARTPCVARTYGQHATPTTIGWKAAVWAAGIADAAAALPAAAAGARVASLGGPAGTLPAFGARAPEVADAFALEIGLEPAPIAWHARRVGIAQAGLAVATLVAALAKMAGDVAHLASTEVGEVAEPHAPGRGGSSAMPHKRNPVGATAIAAAAAAARGLAPTLLDAVAHARHERPAGAWHAEWHATPALFGLASGALREARALAEGLVVDEAAAARNLALTKGLVFADAAAAALAPTFGARAPGIVAQAADRARAEGIGLDAALAARGDVPAEALARAFDPLPAIEAAASFVPRALAAVAAARAALAPLAEAPR